MRVYILLWETNNVDIPAIDSVWANREDARKRGNEIVDQLRWKVGPVIKVEEVEDHQHDFSAGPNCAGCGLHASTVEGGALSPEMITRRLKEGKTILT